MYNRVRAGAQYIFEPTDAVKTNRRCEMKAVGFMVYHPGGWEYFQADELERADKFAQALAIETGKAIAVYTRRGTILKTHYPLGPVHSGIGHFRMALGLLLSQGERGKHAK